MKNDFITNIVPGDVLFFRTVPKVFYLILGVGPDRGYTFISYRFGRWKFVKLDTGFVNQCFPTSSWVRLRC